MKDVSFGLASQYQVPNHLAEADPFPLLWVVAPRKKKSWSTKTQQRASAPALGASAISPATWSHGKTPSISIFSLWVVLVCVLSAFSFGIDIPWSPIPTRRRSGNSDAAIHPTWSIVHLLAHVFSSFGSRTSLPVL
jgi:hypothetical protein